jgi:hypothetical protein
MGVIGITHGRHASDAGRISGSMLSLMESRTMVRKFPCCWLFAALLLTSMPTVMAVVIPYPSRMSAPIGVNVPVLRDAVQGNMDRLAIRRRGSACELEQENSVEKLRSNTLTPLFAQVLRNPPGLSSNSQRSRCSMPVLSLRARKICLQV